MLGQEKILSFFCPIPLYFLSNLWITNNKSSQPIITIVSKTIEAKPVMLQNFHKEADMKSGAINIDDYIGVQPEEQFEFIYTHYPIMHIPQELRIRSGGRERHSASN